MPLRALPVPRHLQTPMRIMYPVHSKGDGIEDYFRKYAQLIPEAHTDLIYLPIGWWGNTYAYSKDRGLKGYYPVPGVQEFVDTQLDPNQRYFTVSQPDEGPYENLPDNVLVFSAGGTGHVPIPLLCDPHPHLTHDRKYLACFVGMVECGGPKKWPMGKAEHSTWDKDGAGARVRRYMWKIFSKEPDSYLINHGGHKPKDSETFRNAAAKSWFGLCPRGYGKTSFRLYEMLQMGVIPVYIYDEPWLPYVSYLDWHKLAVLCHESEMSGLPKRLASITEDQRRRMLIYGASMLGFFFTMGSCCHRIVKYVENYTFDELKNWQDNHDYFRRAG